MLVINQTCKIRLLLENLELVILVAEMQGIAEDLVSEHKADGNHRHHQRNPFLCDFQVKQGIHQQKDDGGLVEEIGQEHQKQKGNGPLFPAAVVADCPNAHCDGLSQSRKKHGEGGNAHKEGNGQQIVTALLQIEHHNGGQGQQGAEKEIELKAVDGFLADRSEQEKSWLRNGEVKQGQEADWPGMIEFIAVGQKVNAAVDASQRQQKNEKQEKHQQREFFIHNPPVVAVGGQRQQHGNPNQKVVWKHAVFSFQRTPCRVQRGPASIQPIC